MTRLRELLLASRPLSWINTGLPFLAAAYEVDRALTPLGLLGFAYFLVPFNLLMYGVNDIFDYASDLANPRKRSLEGGIVPPDRRRATWAAIAATNLPFLALLGWLAPPAGFAAVLLAAFAALAYSAPPLRTKVRPFLDSLTSASHFVLPAVAGFLVAGLDPAALPWALIVGFTAWGVASHALGAIQDIAYDRAAGIGSIATAIGARPTALLALAGYGIAIGAALSYGGLAAVAGLALATYLLLPFAVLCRPDEPQARRAWRSFLGLNLLVGFVLTQLLLRHWGLVTLPLGAALGAAAVAAAGTSLVQLLATVVLLRRSRASALAGAGTAALPRLSVVVPCRDEAVRLPAVIAALAAQDHPDLEIVVIDDGSTDGTADIARRELAARRPTGGDRDRVVVAPPMPAGWTGKSWACDVGARTAIGGHVLFLDADTLPAPSALRTLHAIARGSRAALVSGVSAYAMPTTTERALVPGFPLVMYGLVPVWAAILGRGRSGYRFAYGPLLLVEAAAYRAAGGHAAAPASAREDLDLAATIGRAGGEVRLVAAADLAATRHYPDGTGALAAWRRVAVAYGGDSFATILALLAVEALAWLLPLVAPLAGAALGDPDLLGAGLVALGALVAFRVGLAVAERQPLAAIVWHPITVGATMAAQAASLVDAVLGRPAIWHGRSLERKAP